MKSTTLRKIGFASISIFLAVAAGIFAYKQIISRPVVAPTLSPSPAASSEPTHTPNSQVKTIEYRFVAEKSGQTALELLEANAKVETKKYDFGIFIESIEGLKGDEKNFWAFYVNEESALKGADSTILKEGDTITFRYEPVTAFENQ